MHGPPFKSEQVKPKYNLHSGMLLPNAELAVVEPEKVRDYLLSSIHPIGRFKAAFFATLGYERAQWQVLRDDLLAIAESGTSVAGQPSAYGRKYEVDGILTGPSGRSMPVRTVWIVRPADRVPRLVTAFPR